MAPSGISGVKEYTVDADSQELAIYGIDRATLERMYEEWLAGATKSGLERRYLNKPESHGKLFTSLVRRHLGFETEKKSKSSVNIIELQERIKSLQEENRRLRNLLREHDVQP